MNRSTTTARMSLQDQLGPMRDQIGRSESVSLVSSNPIGSSLPDAHVHRAEDEPLVFPELMSVEEIVVPQDPVPAVKDAGLPAALKSNTEYWLHFESNIDDFATAKTLVDFLDAHPQMRFQVNGLYLKAQITIKRSQVVYAKERDAVQQVQVTASQAALLHEERQLAAARQSTPSFMLGRLVGTLGRSLVPNAPGLGVLLLVATGCIAKLWSN